MRRVSTGAVHRRNRLLPSCLDALPDGGRRPQLSGALFSAALPHGIGSRTSCTVISMLRHFVYMHALARLLPIGQPMTQEPANVSRKRVGRLIRFGVVIAAVVTLLLVVLDTDIHPRTDDASVRANFIEIAPEVSGRLAQLPVKDNAYVKQGELLFVIDPRASEYALWE